jgi:peptidyl-tRNA hydrolase
MLLVAGLGNPGEEYALTPHNMGFLTVDRLAERHGIRVTRKDSRALIGLGEIGLGEIGRRDHRQGGKVGQTPPRLPHR